MHSCNIRFHLTFSATLFPVSLHTWQICILTSVSFGKSGKIQCQTWPKDKSWPPNMSVIHDSWWTGVSHDSCYNKTYSLWHSKSEKNEMFAENLKDNVFATDENTENLPEYTCKLWTMMEGGIWLDQSLCWLCFCFSWKRIGGHLAGEWMAAVFSHLVIFGEYLSSLLIQLHCSILLWIRRWKEKQRETN